MPNALINDLAVGLLLLGEWSRHANRRRNEETSGENGWRE